MNKTRKLTQGAMLLAIVGALMVIDRQIGYFFSYLIAMMFAVIIVVYSAMYTVKDGLFLGLCLGVLSILLGDPQSTYLYYPISFLAGTVYSYALKKGASKRILLVLSILVFVLGEFIIFYVIQPLLFNLTIAQQVESIKETMATMGYDKYYEVLGTALPTILMASMAIGVIVYGLAEGAMIHLFSIFIMKRFRIMDVSITPFSTTKPNPTVFYICFALVGLITFQQYYMQYETLYMIVISVAALASMLLAFYGYMYFVVSSKLKTGRNASFFIILVIFFGFPISYFVLVIIGFLYGSGPFYEKLQRLKEEIAERNRKDITKL